FVVIVLHLLIPLIQYLILIQTYSCTMFFFFFYNDPSTTEIYTLSLHDALPIYESDNFREDLRKLRGGKEVEEIREEREQEKETGDRKSTRLNSSHVSISYAVFCLKKKKKKKKKKK